MFKHFDRKHRVEWITCPFQVVEIAADIRLLCRIDIETYIALGANVTCIRRRLCADIEHDSGIEPRELPS